MGQNTNERALDRGTSYAAVLRRHDRACRQEAAADPQPEVHIMVDKFAKYEKVAETLADLQSRGLKKIGFINP
jgi:biopolymer transport protein ExbD